MHRQPHHWPTLSVPSDAKRSTRPRAENKQQSFLEQTLKRTCENPSKILCRDAGLALLIFHPLSRELPLLLAPSPEERGNVCVCGCHPSLEVSPSSSGGRGRGMEEVSEKKIEDEGCVRMLVKCFL